MATEEKKVYTCEKCGCEAELVIKDESRPRQGTLVCKICGGEADIILEEA